MTRPAHAPTATCTVCHERPGFLEVSPVGTASYECAPCRVFRAQCDAAHDQLSEAVAPTLGMWAAQWTRAGLPVDELAGIIEGLTGDWAQHDVAQEYRRRTLRALAATYRHAAQEEEAPPTRVQVRVADLRCVARVMFDQTAPAALRGRPYLFDATDRQIHTFMGRDLTVCALPDGTRAVTYSERPEDSFLCPPALWPDVSAALGFELPEDVAS